MGVKENYETKRKRSHQQQAQPQKKITTSYLRKEQQ
jgi:hypothetical protein